VAASNDPFTLTFSWGTPRSHLNPSPPTPHQSTPNPNPNPNPQAYLKGSHTLLMEDMERARRNGYK